MKDGYVKCGFKGGNLIKSPSSFPTHTPQSPISPFYPLYLQIPVARGDWRIILWRKWYTQTENIQVLMIGNTTKSQIYICSLKRKRYRLTSPTATRGKMSAYALLMYEWKSRAEPLFGLLPNSPFKIPTCHKQKTKMYQRIHDTYHSILSTELLQWLKTISMHSNILNKNKFLTILIKTRCLHFKCLHFNLHFLIKYVQIVYTLSTIMVSFNSYHYYQ